MILREELNNGIMDKSMKELINMVKKLVMVYLNGLMVPNMKENYLMVCLMEMESIAGKMEKK